MSKEPKHHKIFEMLETEILALKQENEKLKQRLKQCYEIAYELMPSGFCDVKIMRYALDLREIHKLIGDVDNERLTET